MRTTLFPVLLAACLFSPAQTEARQIDQRLAERVGERVTSYAGLTIFDHVTVTVTRGVVTLGGAVTTPLKKREIGDLAGAVRGVERVENTVRVLPALPSDSRLRLAIAQAIYDHPAFRPYAGLARPPIHIIVDTGHVTLAGMVNHETERSLAIALAHVPGAFTVTSELRVERHPQTPAP